MSTSLVNISNIKAMLAYNYRPPS